jgi:hypothetical protein
MKILVASIAALSLIAAAAPAAAEPDAATAASSQPSAAAGEGSAATPKAERKFCRRFDNSARRTQNVLLCLTREQWKKFQEQQED